MAAVAKYFLLAVMLVLLDLGADTQTAAATQNCSAELGRVTVCAPFVVPGPGSGPPSDECCSALRGMDNTCVCNTMDIINRLPGSCNLPPVTCLSKLIHPYLANFFVSSLFH